MIKFTLIRSARKTLSLSVSKELEVIVRAPEKLSRKAIDKFVDDHTDWIEKQMQKQAERAEKYPEPDECEKKRLIDMAREYLPQRLEYYSHIMGVRYGNVKITGAKTRFGSCSVKNDICFSWRLMRYPPDAVDYVVVHELAHIRHKNHSREFYAFVEKFMPDYKKRMKKLKE